MSAPQTTPDPAADPAAADEAEGKIHGSISARYRADGTGSDRDQDIFSLLDVEVGDEATDPWTASLVARVAKDLDGNHNSDGSPFVGPEDSFDSSLTAQVYEAHVDLHDVPDVELMRIGRQSIDETPELVIFDGVRAESEATGDWKQSYGVYGGQTVHYYESSSQGDAVWGGWLVDHPWAHGRTRLDFMHLEDDDYTNSREDNLYAVEVVHAFPPSVNLQAEYSVLGSESRDFGMRALWQDAEDDVMVRGSYYQLLQSENELPDELDPFTSALNELFPYKQAGLVASKSWGGDFDLDGGVDARRVSDHQDEGDFNRDFQRLYLTATQHHVALDGLSLALTGDWWSSNGTDTDSWGFDATHEWSKALRASLGTYYSLFKNDFFNDTEREDVRTWYATMKYVATAQLTWGFGYQTENSTDGDFHTVTARATWKF